MKTFQSVGRRLVGLLAFGAVLVSLGCEEQKLVFLGPDTVGVPVEVPRNVANPPPDGAFLGYFDSGEKLTTCGNCHVGQQSGWETTAHSGAYGSIAAFAQPFCLGCHNVSQLGNGLGTSVLSGDLDAAGGWNAVEDTVYFDVQCENCHGAGNTHVQNPDATQPLASLKVFEVDAATNDTIFLACGECHSDAHHPFVEEWEQSPHAEPFGLFFPQDPPEECASCAAANPACVRCHRGQGILESWGENANYVEKFDAEHMPITCAVCHDAHDATNEHQVRFPVDDVADVNDHLCARCHDRRSVPDAGSEHGLEPHSPETALIQGEAGFFFAGMPIGSGDVRGTHGNPAVNTGLCATCHLATYEIRDPDSNDHIFTVTGHLFRPIPCVDAQGIPLPFGVACGLTVQERFFGSCVDAGCHGDETAAFSAVTAARNRMEPKVANLIDILKIVEANTGGDSTDLEAEGGEIDPFLSTLTVAEQAFFNYHLAIFGSGEFGTNTVLGSAVHNPFLIELLIDASIAEVEAEYAAILPVVRPASEWQARFQAVLDRVPR
jgi:hypothetical protein